MAIEIISTASAQPKSAESVTKQTATTALPFVAQFPISTQNFEQTLNPRIGQKYPRGKYDRPKETTKVNVKAFIRALNDYDNNPTPQTMAELNDLLKKLDMSAVRLQELPDDAVVFYPNNTKNNNTPLVTGAVIVWRFGKTQVPGNPATYNNPLTQMVVFDPHSGQDGTLYTITDQFLGPKNEIPSIGAKVLVCNAFNPNVALNPDYKGGKITHNNIKRFTDPSHSDTTIVTEIAKAIYSVFPNAMGTITHGMKGADNFQLLMGNDFNNQYLLGKSSFPALLAIALALEQLERSKAASLPVDPNKVVAGSTVPGYFVLNGEKVPVISRDPSKSSIRKTQGASLNSDVLGHIANGATLNIFNLGKQKDRLVHAEFAGYFRSKESLLRDIFVAAQAKASVWTTQFDPEVHALDKLEERFPDVYHHMELFPQLFNPEFIKAYKEQGINPYNSRAVSLTSTVTSTVKTVSDKARSLIVGERTADQTAEDVIKTSDDLTDPTDNTVNSIDDEPETIEETCADEAPAKTVLFAYKPVIEPVVTVEAPAAKRAPRR